MTWRGYKLYIDTMDGDVPISAHLISASVHDSQVAIIDYNKRRGEAKELEPQGQLQMCKCSDMRRYLRT
ncbi:MAG TPA: hypothetical protein DCZ94_18885 [Lentisphaeria bacterium]|nr:hypothetical protein [Lentisphaeria bacterium]